MIYSTLTINKLNVTTIKTSLANYWRMLLPLTLCVLLIQPSTYEITISVLSDAFWQVAVFVASTLVIYHLFADKISQLSVNKQGVRQPIYEIVTASFMGMLPGCGGAIVVITQFVSGKMSFAAVTAVLTATMGDAAFLLLAAEPLTGLGMMALCFSVGIVAGIVVDNIHGADFLRQTANQKKSLKATPLNSSKQAIQYKKAIPKRLKLQGLLWQWLVVPGVIIGLLIAGQVDVASLIGMSNSALQLIGTVIVLSCIFLWAGTCKVTDYESIVCEDKKQQKIKVFQKVALDTNFVVSWVVVAFLAFELILFYSAVDLTNVFKHFSAVGPLLGVVVGMIPGCGPQILTTSLYLSGAIPLSTQIGNAISNDGDALFPAIALSPKVAFVATFYSAIPAIISAYCYYWLFE